MNGPPVARMSQLEYLRRLSSEPATLTVQDRIAYLEQCYMRDPISGDTRMRLARQIEDLKAQAATESK